MFTRLWSFLTLYRSLRRDPTVSPLAKYLPWVAVIYLFMPFDIIPDILPFIGQADDLTTLIILLWVAIRSVTEHQYAQHRKDTKPIIDINPIQPEKTGASNHK